MDFMNAVIERTEEKGERRRVCSALTVPNPHLHSSLWLMYNKVFWFVYITHARVLLDY